MDDASGGVDLASQASMRSYGRAEDQLRPVTLTPGVMKNADGSCLAEFGDTRVICTATIE